MIDTEGNVVYSAFKGVDLGTNLLRRPVPAVEPRRRVSRGDGASNIVGDVVLADFAALQPEPRQSRRLGRDPDRRSTARSSARSRSSCRSTASTTS